MGPGTSQVVQWVKTALPLKEGRFDPGRLKIPVPCGMAKKLNKKAHVWLNIASC